MPMPAPNEPDPAAPAEPDLADVELLPQVSASLAIVGQRAPQQTLAIPRRGRGLRWVLLLVLLAGLGSAAAGGACCARCRSRSRILCAARRSRRSMRPASWKLSTPPASAAP